MLFSILALPAPFATAAGFLVGGACGMATIRFARSTRDKATLTFVDASGRAERSVVAAPFPVHSAPVLVAPGFDSRASALRVRTGRLPLPQCVSKLTPVDEPGLAAVNRFVDRLADLPIRDWFDVGRQQMVDSAVSQRAASFAALEATIDAGGLGVAAWYVRDTVETAAFLAAAAVPRWTRTERRIFAAAHGAAEDAALALLARRGLTASDLAVLVAPFERLNG